MTLSSFIATQHVQILRTWEQDARKRIPASDRQNISSIRDHLGELLEAIARDLEAASRTAPAPGQQAHAHETWSNVEAVATKHGIGRAHQGITLHEMMPEFPALRSTVARLWRQSLSSASVADLEDLIRFDEAMDWAMTRSISEFMDRLNRSRETFLGILGHDLRNPLSTIMAAAGLMRENGFECAKVPEVAERIVDTGQRMNQLVVDLLDFTRTRLGGQMAIKPHETDLGEVIRDITDEFTTSHPERHVDVHISDNLHGYWDDKRMSQAIGNLLANAVAHGAKNRPIEVSASADDSEVAIVVHNEGPPIPEEEREHLFEPLSIANHHDKAEKPKHIGLGLYIAKAIVGGHGGRIDVESDDEHGTTFTLHLPRHGAPKRAHTDPKRDANA